MRFIISSFLFICYHYTSAQFITPFEKSKGVETTTYTDCIKYYEQLAVRYPQIQVKKFGMTDAGYPLTLVLLSKDGKMNPSTWHQQNKVVMLINNGIHPGEPDGIDASMMLVRDLLTGKVQWPNNIAIGLIPIYNIGGALNRNAFSRVNQDGPIEYGFRGNAQNLDLNRDFIKNDSKNAQTLATIFHYLNPDIFIDNHVSDGADYQHVMTLLTTQHNKLGGKVGELMHQIFEPRIYASMKEKNFPIIPYVNYFGTNPDKGWSAYFEGPRYSSGYAALFQTMAFVPETHMLKPFPQRVAATYALMESFITTASDLGNEIKKARRTDKEAIKQQKQFPLNWKIDSSRYQTFTFLGYEAEKKLSEVTGLDRIFYNRAKPFTKEVKFYNYFNPDKMVSKPKAYIIPQGWHAVINLLRLNQVKMKPLEKDTLINVEVYRIEDYKTTTRPYEKHYRHFDIQVSKQQQKVRFLKGDIILYTGQTADRFLVEVLEPIGDDSYFAWNFFDAILQQKEGYSDYRWEDVAAAFLKQHPAIQQLLDEKKKTDAKFAASASQQLDFVYKHSPYYEPAHLRYPVYRLLE